MSNQNLRYIKAKEKDRIEIIMVNVVMTEEIIKICIDEIEEIEEFNLVEELSMNKMEVDQGMNEIIEMIIGEEILEVT